jgi:hypothetical protein
MVESCVAERQRVGEFNTLEQYVRLANFVNAAGEAYVKLENDRTVDCRSVFSLVAELRPGQPFEVKGNPDLTPVVEAYLMKPTEHRAYESE